MAGANICLNFESVTKLTHCCKIKLFLSKLFVLFLIDSAEKDFVGAALVQVLHKLLTEDKSAPEIKYNSMILICSVMGSGEECLPCGYKTAC